MTAQASPPVGFRADQAPERQAPANPLVEQADWWRNPLWAGRRGCAHLDWTSLLSSGPALGWPITLRRCAFWCGRIMSKSPH